jgi:hypothetical protein
MSDGMTEMAREEQVGGNHYRKHKIQPIQYIVANKIGFLAGNVVKYVTRYKDKGGAEDIRKAMHYLELILEFEYPTTVKAPGQAIDTPLAYTLPPITSGSVRDEGELLYLSPKLILKLEADDPDTIGDLYGSVRSHQEGCNAQGSGQSAGCSDQSERHQEGGCQGAPRR